MVARLATVLLAVTAVAFATAPALAAAAPAGPAPAGARMATCQRSPAIDKRLAAVTAWMRPIPGGRRLALRLELWERTPGERWTPRSDVPGLGAWIEPSQKGVGSQAGDLFKYRQAVGRLAVPATYRFQVSFRWYGVDGSIVREAATTTRLCRQTDLRPDLVLHAATATPSTRSPGLVQYAVLVGNEGKSIVPRAAIAAAFPGTAGPASSTRAIRSLAPGKTVHVIFTGPGCAAGELPATFFADPSHAVDEASEANNALAAACPAP